MGPLICCYKSVTDNYGAHQNTKLDLKKKSYLLLHLKLGFCQGIVCLDLSQSL